MPSSRPTVDGLPEPVVGHRSSLAYDGCDGGGVANVPDRQARFVAVVGDPHPAVGGNIRSRCGWDGLGLGYKCLIYRPGPAWRALTIGWISKATSLLVTGAGFPADVGVRRPGI